MLHDSKYSSWVDNIFAGVKVATMFRSLRQWHSSTRYLMDEVLVKTEGAQKQMRTHQQYTNERVDRRLQRQPEHPDLWSKILAKNDEEGGLSMDEQYSNASLFMMAGADATAMALAGTTYYLLRNPHYLDKVTEEIRGAFTDLSEVTSDKAARLKYLHAAPHEAMRIHPPNPISLLRTVPKGGLTICDQYVPENVNVAINHYANSRREEHFKHPDEFHPERWLGAEEYENDHLDASEVSQYLRIRVRSSTTDFFVAIYGRSKELRRQSRSLLFRTTCFGMLIRLEFCLARNAAPADWRFPRLRFEAK